MKFVITALLLAFGATNAVAQFQQQNVSKVESWLSVQFIPSLVLLSTPSATPFGFEWEVTPLLYSFGMTKLVSPWYAFLVEPPARFAGSIELVTSGQLFTTKVGTSYFGGSVQLLGHLPLVEKGEHLGLNIGLAKYFYSDRQPFFKVLGISTVFGMLHLNVKHSSSPTIWMGSLEFRMF
jgi:hypothetical protein